MDELLEEMLSNLIENNSIRMVHINGKLTKIRNANINVRMDPILNNLGTNNSNSSNNNNNSSSNSNSDTANSSNSDGARSDTGKRYGIVEGDNVMGDDFYYYEGKNSRNRVEELPKNNSR